MSISALPVTVPYVHRTTDPCFLHCLEQLIYNTIDELEVACKCRRVTVAAVSATDYYYYYYYVYKGFIIHDTVVQGERGRFAFL
jgi:hypothetical protein